jgi:hypothetical protein
MLHPVMYGARQFFQSWSRSPSLAFLPEHDRTELMLCILHSISHEFLIDSIPYRPLSHLYVPTYVRIC